MALARFGPTAANSSICHFKRSARSVLRAPRPSVLAWACRRSPTVAGHRFGRRKPRSGDTPENGFRASLEMTIEVVWPQARRLLGGVGVSGHTAGESMV